MPSTACTVCKRKKRKCDGGNPCGLCSKYGSTGDCEFDNSNSGKAGVNLKKRFACVSCRRKKRKCDGEPVCGICKSLGKHSECVYDNASTKCPVPRVRELMPQDLVNPASKKPGCAPSRARKSARQTISYIVPTIPEEFDSALSGVSVDDLSLTFRLCFLSHRVQLGLVLNAEQQKAIVHGDMFSGAVHPFFIHYSHIFGCHFYQELKSDFMLLYLQSIYVYMSVESLSTIREDLQPLTCAIAHFMISEMYLYTKHLDFGTHYLKLAAEIVKRQGIKFIMRSKSESVQDAATATSTVNASDEVLERVGFLAQMLYVDTDLFLVAGQVPTLPPEIEQEFRFDLPLAHPGMWKSCVLVMRTKSVLFIKEATAQMKEFDHESLVTKARYSIFNQLLQVISAHIEDMRGLLERLDSAEDYERTICIRYSIITCLTSVAQLHDTMAAPGNDSPELLRKALVELVAVSQNLSEKDFYLLDPYVGICWTRVVSLIQKNQPPAGISQESGSCDSLILDKQLGRLGNEATITKLLRAKARLDVSTHMTPSGPGSLCAKLVAMNEKLRKRCPDRVASDEVNRVFRY